MIDKKTVFVLGAGASCPYGYPSGVRLRERICLSQGFMQDYGTSQPGQTAGEIKLLREFIEFKDTFTKSGIKSIDLFIANNPKLASVGKYIIAFEIVRAERRSCFGEEAKLQQETLAYSQSHGRVGPADLLSQIIFQGGDWYSYLYNRLIEGLVVKKTVPDFSDGKLVFITFNYDRSLEQFLYEALRNSFTEMSEDQIVQSLKKLKILHIYGQIAPLKWQNPDDYIDYKSRNDESLLQRAANNIRTIYEEKQNPELVEAQNLLKQAEQIFFLGFGYAQENMEVLGLPGLIPPTCQVYGTAFDMINEEIKRIETAMHLGRKAGSGGDYKGSTRIEPLDCLMLLRKYLN